MQNTGNWNLGLSSASGASPSTSTCWTNQRPSQSQLNLGITYQPVLTDQWARNQMSQMDSAVQKGSTQQRSQRASCYVKTISVYAVC